MAGTDNLDQLADAVTGAGIEGRGTAIIVDGLVIPAQINGEIAATFDRPEVDISGFATRGDRLSINSELSAPTTWTLDQFYDPRLAWFETFFNDPDAATREREIYIVAKQGQVATGSGEQLNAFWFYEHGQLGPTATTLPNVDAAMNTTWALRGGRTRVCYQAQRNAAVPTSQTFTAIKTANISSGDIVARVRIQDTGLPTGKRPGPAFPTAEAGAGGEDNAKFTFDGEFVRAAQDLTTTGSAASNGVYNLRLRTFGIPGYRINDDSLSVVTDFTLTVTA